MIEINDECRAMFEDAYQVMTGQKPRISRKVTGVEEWERRCAEQNAPVWQDLDSDKDAIEDFCDDAG